MYTFILLINNMNQKEISEGALLRFLNELAAFEPCRHQQNHREDANQVRICSPVSLPGSRENCHQHHPSSQPVQTGDRPLGEAATSGRT